MAQWLETAQRLPLWLHAVYLAALAVASFIIAFHDLTPNGWPVILCLLAAGALAMGAWCVYEHVTRNRKKGEEEGSDAFSELPASLVVLPIFDVTLTGLTLTFSSAVDSVGWVIVLIILLLVMLALGLIISLIAFRTRQPPASPSRTNVKVDSRGCDELSAWSIPVVYSLTALIELLVIFCLALNVVPLGAMLVACLLQLAVLVCTALSVVWIVLYRKHHNSLPILRNFEDFIFSRAKSTKGTADMKTGPTNIYYLPIGPINTKASEFENALRRFVAAKGGKFNLQQLPSNASSDVISGRSVILVPCFQDGGVIHLASDVRSVMEVAGTMLAAHSPGVTKIWLVVFHRHSPELGDIETTFETLSGTFFEEFRKAYKAFCVFDVVYGQNGSFFANATNTESFALMTSYIIQPNDI